MVKQIALHIREAVESRDHRLMLHVHRWMAPRWVRLWMVCATRGGDGWLWYTVGLVLLFAGGPERFRALGEAGLAAGLGMVVFLWLKRKCGRTRPCNMQPHCWSTLLPPDRFSFPSGHTITALAVSTVLGEYYPGLAPGLAFCAASIAVSRILLGMHFLSDVVAGAVIGYLLACGVHAW